MKGKGIIIFFLLIVIFKFLFYTTFSSGSFFAFNFNRLSDEPFKLFLYFLELVSASPKPEFSSIINSLFIEDWPYLPAGGGLHSK